MIFCDFYLPSYKSGGGMWTIVNLVDRFCHQYDFYIVTRNYDSKGDKTPYTTVKTDEWNRTGNADVYYFSPKNLSRSFFVGLINEIKPDAFFLNSAFATPVIKFLMARRNKTIAGIPLILAPCGEFTAAGLSLKPLKKKIFLQYAKSVDLYRNIIWKASSEAEKIEIKEVVGGDAEVWIAPDLTPKTILPDYIPKLKPLKEKGSVKFVFLSRIVRKKNIHFFLERLREIKSGKVEFAVIGPPEDLDYVRECQTLAKTLPENISVTFTGAFPYGEALEKICESHFFVLPTLNENFGYVCIEALAAGSPLLLSDGTIWTDVQNHNAGWSIPLEDVSAWNNQIENCLNMNDSEYKRMSAAARSYSLEWLAEPKHAQETAKILDRAFGKKAKNVAG
jgi:glycosyltransferase involved in cell wall biosynthesis